MGATEFFCYDNSKWKRAVGKSRRLEASQEPVRVVRDGYVLPLRMIPGTSDQFGDGMFEGGVSDANFEFVAGQYRSHLAKEGNRCCVRSYEPEAGQVEFRDEEVVFGGILTNQWGHMLVDATSRLWYVVDRLEEVDKVVFVAVPGQDFPFRDLLDLAGITEDKYEIVSKPTRFASIVVPEESSHSLTGYFTDNWMRFFDKVRDAVEPGPYKNVYLSRTAFEIRNVMGEEYFENFFRAHGYHVAHPEQLSIDEQVALIAGADSIATTMGTMAHMVAFAQEGTELIVLNRSSRVVNAQVCINEARGVRSVFVDAYRNYLPEQQAGNCIFLLAPNSHWDAMVKLHFGEEPDRAYLGNEFPRLILDYMSEWGRFFSDRANYTWIRNQDLRQLVKRVNEAANDVEVDVSDFPEPKKYELLRKELALASVSEGTFASELSCEGGMLVFAGSFQKGNGELASIAICFSRAEDLRDSEMAFQASFEEVADLIRWTARFPLSELRAKVEALGPLCLGMQLDASDGSHARSLLFDGEPGKPVARWFLGEGKALSLEDDAQGRLFLREAEVELDQVVDRFWIEDITWGDDALVLRGELFTSYRFDEDIHYGLDLVSDGKVRACSPLVFERDDAALVWSCRLPRASVVSAFASDNVGLLSVQLEIRHGDQTALMPVGNKRKSGSISQFRGSVVSLGDESYAYPVEDRSMFAFKRGELSDTVRHFRIENLDWKDYSLVMSGGFDTFATNRVPTAELQLLGEDGCPLVAAPMRLEALSGDEFFWSSELAVSSFGSWPKTVGKGQLLSLEVKLDYQDGSCAFALGKSRRPGTAAIFEDGFLPLEDGILLATRTPEDNFAFRYAEKADAIGRFQFEEFGWGDDGLALSGYLDSPSYLPVGDAEFVAMAGDEAVVLAQLSVEGSPEHRRHWEATIPFSRACTELWPFLGGSEHVVARWMLRASIGDSAILVPVGAKREPGSLALLKSRVLDFDGGPALLIDEDGDKNFVMRGCSGSDVLRRLWIARVDWRDGTLCLDGTIDAPQGLSHERNCRLSLVCDSETIDVAPLMELGPNLWYATVTAPSVVAALEGLEGASASLALHIGFGDCSFAIPVGAKRAKGTLPKLKESHFSISKSSYSFGQDGNHNLVLLEEETNTGKRKGHKGGLFSRARGK